jgi:hypothetical protein
MLLTRIFLLRHFKCAENGSAENKHTLVSRDNTTCAFTKVRAKQVQGEEQLNECTLSESVSI